MTWWYHIAVIYTCVCVIMVKTPILTYVLGFKTSDEGICWHNVWEHIWIGSPSLEAVGIGCAFPTNLSRSNFMSITRYMYSLYFELNGHSSIYQGPVKYTEWCLTLKHRESHGCVVSTVATDALVLKHHAISIHNADLTFIVLDQFHIKISHLWWTTLRNKITFLKTRQIWGIW